jgi:small basic protein
VIALAGLLIGIIAGLILEPTVPVWFQPYLPIAIIAALDAVVGATRALLDGVFRDRVFVISFLSNVAVAAIIVWIGDLLGVGGQMTTGVVVVLTMRIFANAAAIRRHLLRA